MRPGRRHVSSGIIGEHRTGADQDRIGFGTQQVRERPRLGACHPHRRTVAERDAMPGIERHLDLNERPPLGLAEDMAEGDPARILGADADLDD